MLNVAFAHEHFAMVSGVIHKRLANGQLRPITAVRSGRLEAVVNGEVHLGMDLAWCLYYNSAPVYPLVCLDGDPQNLAKENIFAVRRKRLRFRCLDRGWGFKHPLSAVSFRNSIACFDDWVRLARKYYMEDMAFVLEAERVRNEQLGVARYVRPKKTRVPVGRVLPPRPLPPQAFAGFKNYWYEGQWVQVPEAVHPADDYRVRCAAVLLGAVRFEYSVEDSRVYGYNAADVRVN